MEWISVKDHLPTEEKQYIVTRDCFGHRILGTANWSNDLYNTDKYDFWDEEKQRGFWNSDLDFGKYKEVDVIAWLNVGIYEGE